MLLSIFLLFTICYFVSVILLLKGLYSLPNRGERSGCTFSVVIAAKNEQFNIADCLDSILAQTISDGRFEVIVVNDRSRDETAQIAGRYAISHSNVTLINIDETPPGFSPKKYAVHKGVEAAVNDVVVFTDADCRVNPEWLDTIDCYFSTDTGMVQGITTYRYPHGMNKLFYGLQAVDFLSHGIVAAAGIGLGMPINSNANNLSFRRDAFLETGGYGESAQEVVSGDDDLLLQRIWKSGKWKISFMCDQAGAVLTEPTATLKGIFEQRKRWGSKTVHYGPGQVAFLSVIFLYYLSIPVALLCATFQLYYLSVFAGMIIIKMLGEFLLLIPGTALFSRRDLRKFIIPGSLLQLPLVIGAVFWGTFGRFSWKDQKFKRKVSGSRRNRALRES